MDIDDKYKTTEEYIQAGIDYIKGADENYTIPRWYKQPNYIEIWIEKMPLYLRSGRYFMTMPSIAERLELFLIEDGQV